MTMQRLGIWNGGHGNYMPGYLDYDLEQFDSIEAAKNALAERYRRGHYVRQDFAYVNREWACSFTPAVGKDCTIDLYVKHDGELVRTHVISFGARGGIAVEEVS